MSTTIEDAMYEMAMDEIHQGEYEQELIDTAIEELPVENIRSYLGTYGDAIEKRVKKCVNEANELLKSKHCGPALVAAVTAIEIIFKFFILRPLVEGTLLTDKLATILLRRILPGQAARCAELLPSVTEHWGIPLKDLKLSSDNNLWDALKKEVFPKRNAVVHKADEVADTCSLIAIECVDILMKGVVTPLAKKFGLSWPESGVWHKYSCKTKTAAIWYGSYEPSDPFK